MLGTNKVKGEKMKKLALIAFINLNLFATTVVDSKTNFEWYDTQKAMEHEQAVKYCSELSLDGKKDWHLPTVKELLTIYDFSHKLNLPKSKKVKKGILKGYSVSETTLDKSVNLDFLNNGKTKKELHFVKDNSPLSFLDGYWSASLYEYGLYKNGETLYWSLSKNKFQMKRLSPEAKEYVLCVRGTK